MSKTFFSSKQRKQVVLLYFSIAINTVLGMAASIVNTRYLDVNSYGDVRYVFNIISFIASLLLFGYFLSGSRLLALSNHELYSRRIRGALIIILIFACIALGLCSFFCYFIHLYSKPNVASLFLIALPVCFSPLFLNYVNTTAQGDNHIGRLALSQILPFSLYIPIALFIYSNYGASSKVMIFMQWGCSTLVLLCIIISTRPVFRRLSPLLKTINHENKDYGFQLYLGSLIMVTTNYLAGISLGVFNDNNSEVGFYTLASTITSPLAMLPGIIGTAYFKEFAKQKVIPKSVFVFTIIIAILSCILYIIFIKPLVVLLYSENYAIVGLYAACLAIGASVHGIGDMVNRFLGSHGQGKSIRNASIVNGCFKIVGFTILVYVFNTKGAIITSITCSFLYCLVIFYYYIKFIREDVKAEV